ncbi:hypothetical protein B0H13DRAFT_1872875 [Mycena leptocephala]|nr:hypothetical protein B0H13DRAFT_1872875 [Mycena leptocephala]
MRTNIPAAQAPLKRTKPRKNLSPVLPSALPHQASLTSTQRSLRFSVIVTRFCRRIWTLKPDTNSSTRFTRKDVKSWAGWPLSSHPKLTPPTSHDVSPTRRGPRRDNRWEKEEGGLGTTLLWLTVLAHLKPALSPHLRRTLPALCTPCPHEHRTQTAPVAVHATQKNTTGVELALRALAPSTLHISRRNRVLFRHITRAMREVGGGLLADDQSEGNLAFAIHQTLSFSRNPLITPPLPEIQPAELKCFNGASIEVFFAKEGSGPGYPCISVNGCGQCIIARAESSDGIAEVNDGENKHKILEKEIHQRVMNGSRVERVACRYPGGRWIFGGREMKNGHIFRRTVLNQGQQKQKLNPKKENFLSVNADNQEEEESNYTLTRNRVQRSQAKENFNYDVNGRRKNNGTPQADSEEESKVVNCEERRLPVQNSRPRRGGFEIENTNIIDLHHMSHRYMRSAVPAGMEMWTYLGWEKKDRSQSHWH